MKKRLVVLFCVFLLLFTSSAPALATSYDESDLPVIKHYVSIYEYFGYDTQAMSAADSVEEAIALLQENDLYARYLDAEDYNALDETYDGTYTGFGALLALDAAGRIYFQTVYHNSGAEEAGFQSGDILLSVDGVSMEGKTLDQAQAALRGKEGTGVVVEVERAGKTYREIAIRRTMSTPSLFYELLANGVGHFQIDHFTRETANQFADAVEQLAGKGMTSILLDLRDCPGGLLNSASDIGYYLTGHEPTFFYKGAQGYNSVSVSGFERQPIPEYPLAILVNQDTASAAEMLAALMQDDGRGTVIGTGTYGKGCYQSVIGLPSGGALYFTTGVYITRGMQDVMAQGGVTPDVLVTDAAAQQQAALNWLARQTKAARSITLVMGSKQATADGAPLALTGAPFLAAGRSYLPLRQLMTSFGWEVFYYSGDYYFTNGIHRMILTLDDKQIASGRSNDTVLVRNGVSYLPASFLRHVGYTVDWDSTARAVTVRPDYQ